MKQKGLRSPCRQSDRLDDRRERCRRSIVAVRQACAGYVREHGVVQGSWPRGARPVAPEIWAGTFLPPLSDIGALRQLGRL
jgi:hypothetical protein